MRNPLHGIGDGMRKIVHGIDAPCIAGGLMRFVFDTVNDGIAEV
jgi:hypothetical protein